MYQVVIQKRNDGGVTVIWPALTVTEGGGVEMVDTIENMIPQDIEDGEECRVASVRDLPNAREFREAWCDETPETRVDIDLVKAKDIQLNKFREERATYLAASDIAITRAMESESPQQIAALKVKRQALRDATEPLKQLSVSGYNDEAVLAQIRSLGILPQNLKE